MTASDNPSFAKKRCIVREPRFDKLDQACYLWFQQQRSKGAPVSGPVLQEKSRQLSDDGAFNTSSGWLHKFCGWMGIAARKRKQNLNQTKISSYFATDTS